MMKQKILKLYILTECLRSHFYDWNAYQQNDLIIFCSCTLGISVENIFFKIKVIAICYCSLMIKKITTQILARLEWFKFNSIKRLFVLF